MSTCAFGWFFFFELPAPRTLWSSQHLCPRTPPSSLTHRHTYCLGLYTERRKMGCSYSLHLPSLVPIISHKGYYATAIQPFSAVVPLCNSIQVPFQQCFQEHLSVSYCTVSLLRLPLHRMTWDGVNNRHLFPHHLEVYKWETRRLAGLVSPEGSRFSTCRWRSSLSMSHGLVSVLSCVLPFSSKDTSHTGLEPTPMNLLNLNYFLKYQESKHRHVLKL